MACESTHEAESLSSPDVGGTTAAVDWHDTTILDQRTACERRTTRRKVTGDFVVSGPMPPGKRSPQILEKILPRSVVCLTLRCNESGRNVYDVRRVHVRGRSRWRRAHEKPMRCIRSN